VKVENVSKIFCRDLKKSLWYGLQDSASDLFSWGRRIEVRGSQIANQDPSRAHPSNSKFKTQNSESSSTSDSKFEVEDSSLAPRADASDENLRSGEFYAVRDVSFELRRGDCLGLIGRNGAGKTTLLKMLTGLIKPDAGRIEMRGRIGALIALGAGFNPILSGRENIYVNGSILGLSKKEIDEKIDEIIDFAEIGESIDAPVQTYSSGMQVRLGFAVATAMEPDVLIMDEVLAVGDFQFRMKSLARVSEMLSQTAVIFVSHNVDQIRRICTHGIVLEKGKSTYSGSAADAILVYQSGLNQEIRSDDYLGPKVAELSIAGTKKRNQRFRESLELDIGILTRCTVEECAIRVLIHDSDSSLIYEWMSINHGVLVSFQKNEKTTVPVHIDPLPLRPGSYRISIVLTDKNNIIYHAQLKDAVTLDIHGSVAMLGHIQL
jgi:lipopolysaccharide transport system ATP-binding protein